MPTDESFLAISCIPSCIIGYFLWYMKCDVFFKHLSLSYPKQWVTCQLQNIPVINQRYIRGKSLALSVSTIVPQALPEISKQSGMTPPTKKNQHIYVIIQIANSTCTNRNKPQLLSTVNILMSVLKFLNFFFIIFCVLHNFLDLSFLSCSQIDLLRVSIYDQVGYMTIYFLSVDFFYFFTQNPREAQLEPNTARDQMTKGRTIF